jgi:hypothetical protein
LEQEKEAQPQGDNQSKEGDQSKEDQEPKEEKKPWQAKKKDETPEWARVRFKEYSTTVRELKALNQELLKHLANGLQKPTEGAPQFKEEDFPSKEDFTRTVAREEVVAVAREQARVAEEVKVLAEIERNNTELAKEDLPDYEQVIKNAMADPSFKDVRLPVDVLTHLSKSPAGVYVKYRIATDPDFAEALKDANLEQKKDLIANLHDEILDDLIKRRAPKPSVEQGSRTTQVPQQPNTPQVPKAIPPKAPPKAQGSSSRDILSLSGDDYIRERNKRLFGS